MGLKLSGVVFSGVFSVNNVGQSFLGRARSIVLFRRNGSGSGWRRRVVVMVRSGMVDFRFLHARREGRFVTATAIVVLKILMVGLCGVTVVCIVCVVCVVCVVTAVCIIRVVCAIRVVRIRIVVRKIVEVVP